jgi:hypothetical protein
MDTKFRNQLLYMYLQTICIKYGMETWFVYVCSTSSLVVLKTCFETWITRNDVNGVKFVLRFLFNNTSGLPVLTMGTKCPNQVFYVWLGDLQTFALNTWWKRDSLQMIFLYVCSTFSVVELKTCFESLITRNDVNDVNLFLFSYLITLVLYMCSHCSINIQIVVFIFEWSIYILFLLNRWWKLLDPLQMIKFVYVCSTCSAVELKTRYETWITRNVVNGLNLFHLSYLITLTTYLCSQWPQMNISSILCSIGRSTYYLF